MKLKRILQTALLTLLVVGLLVHAPQISRADLGGFSGDSDFGGGDFDWGGGSDWGDSDWGDSDWGDSDWGDSDYSGGSYYSGDGGGIIPVIVIVAIVVISIYSKRKRGGGGGGSVNPGGMRTPESQLRPISELVALDPNFDEAAFVEKMSNLYVQMQNCCTAKNMEPLRPYFTDALYAQFDRQLEAMRQARRTNYVERIAVLGVALRGFMQRNGEDHIIAEVRTRIVDYTLDDATGSLVSGDMNREKFMVYEWDISRASGMQTQDADDMSRVNCPGCGAPLSINTTAECPYCGSIVTLDKHDWAINAIRGISQRTAD